MVDDRDPEAALLKEKGSPPLYTTGHNAKGYEAMTVQLARWTNHGRKPLKRLKEAQLPERRLVYTMLTRSRETLVIPESLWEALGECCEVLGTTLPKPHAF